MQQKTEQKTGCIQLFLRDRAFQDRARVRIGAISCPKLRESLGLVGFQVQSLVGCLCLQRLGPAVMAVRVFCGLSLVFGGPHGRGLAT